MNRLAQETSPYLQQHQHNPVDWHPWGEEALDLARRRDMPIFLSVGYSSCYWCHVMERQCFENAEIAKLMNEHFVNIKVDREERPDVDQLYMMAVQVMTRQGGWPMSVWLLPDLRPFWGGTYYPPQDVQGRPGFVTVLNALTEAFETKRRDIEQTGANLQDVLLRLAQPAEPDEPITYSTGWLEALLLRSINDYEPQHGGFGRAPKFPRQTLLELLLHWINYQRAAGHDASEFEKPLRHTLDAMANGGIRDHLGGGFHRYSTDDQWLVPHFEIMLYDNAMLAWIYAEASRVFNEPRYETVARGICDFVLREMTGGDGLFYTAFDAEVDAREGLYYLWTMADLEQVLAPREAAQFATVYGLDRGPNFADPHHSVDGKPDKSILHLPTGPERESAADIIAMREKLYLHRLSRKKPFLDTKIVTSWNALMIRALAHAGDVLGDARYLEAAGRAIDRLLTLHRAKDGGLLRTSRDGVAKTAAFLDDYAFVAQALLDLHRTTHDTWCLDEAMRIANRMRERFEDPDRGGFFFTDAAARDLLARQKVGSDTPLPAGNAVAAMVCDSLGLTDSAGQALGVFAVQSNHHGESMSAHLQAVLQFVQNHGDLRVEPVEGGRLRLDTPQAKAVKAVQVQHGWRGEKQIMIELDIDPAYHLSDETALESPIDIIEHMEVPQPVRKKFAYADVEKSVLEGRVRVLITLKEPPRAGAIIPLRLTYQACTDSACLPTVTRAVSITR